MLFRFFSNFLAHVRIEIGALLFNFGQINKVLLSKFLVSVKGKDCDLLVLLAEWSRPLSEVKPAKT